MVDVWVAIIIVIIGILGGWLVGHMNDDAIYLDEDPMGELILTKDEDGCYIFLELYEDPSKLEDLDYTILKVRKSSKSR